MNIFAINNRNGIGIVSCSETKISNVFVMSNHNHGILLKSCSDTSVTNISVTNNQWEGIHMHFCKNTSIIIATVSKNNHAGLILTSCVDTSVTRAYAAHNQNEGIRIYASNISMNNVSVEDNEYAGISLLSQSQLQLEDSVFSDVVPLSSPSSAKELQTVPAIIEVIYSTLIVTNCNFSGNSITSIRAVGSNITVQGDIMFADNQALVGAALHFSQSSV